MTAALIGPRIRARRSELKITQTALAARIGVSPSYLNLIEHNRRSIAGALLHRLAEALGLDSRALAGTEESRLIAELAEIAADPAFGGALSPAAARDFVAGDPNAARLLLTVYRAYRDARAHRDLVSERLGEHSFLGEASRQIVGLITTIRSFSGILRDYGDLSETERHRFAGTIAGESERLARLATEMFDFLSGRGARSPHPSAAEEVEDFFSDNANHFPELEEEAARLHDRIGGAASAGIAALAAYLSARHGVRLALHPPTALPVSGEQLAAEGRDLRLSNALAAASLRFRLLRAIAERDCADIIDRLACARIATPEAMRRCRRALAAYVAGAVVMPYEGFHAATRELRNDLELLALRFDASFEQVCHRLTTLQRPRAAGIPMHFLRTDIAGNISKRFGGSGLWLPRYGGACPRWVIHSAFLTPGRVVTQIAQMPDGQTFLFIARTKEAGAGHGSPRSHHAIMVGCSIANAGAIVYADGLDLAAKAVPVGMTCSQCSRTDCAQRAFEQIPLGAPVAPTHDSPADRR